MSCSIRPVTADDFAAIAAITNHYIATSAINFSYQPQTADQVRDQWSAGADRYPWLVATDGDRVIGFARSGEWRHKDAYRWTAEVGVYLDPDRRGSGVGRALYRELLATLAATGFHSAIGGITLPNEASLGLHRSFGFAHVGTVRDAGWKLGAWHDVAFYQRVLAG